MSSSDLLRALQRGWVRSEDWHLYSVSSGAMKARISKLRQLYRVQTRFENKRARYRIVSE